jgi:hypothetical protein
MRRRTERTRQLIEPQDDGLAASRAKTEDGPTRYERARASKWLGVCAYSGTMRALSGLTEAVPQLELRGIGTG